VKLSATFGRKISVQDFSQKPSRLTVVWNAPNPPRKLGAAGESLWFRIQSEYAIGDVGGVELLMQCCLAADRADELAAIIDEDGPRIVTKTGIKDHPLLKHELAARAFICRTLQRLGVTDEPLKSIGRPARSF
jgi:hypothetical protein